MLLTKECDYSVRIVRTLSDGSKKTVEAISEAEHIPNKFAYKILKKLEHAGFLKSLRGRSGGYQISIPLDKITIYDIVTAVDNKLLVSECLQKDTTCPNNTEENPCAVHKEFEEIQEILKKSLTKKSMQEILRS